MRRGGLVRLSPNDESLRYLGPSSGIAMSRLLMEEAKVFTDSKRISELIPEVRARREKRMQSVVMTGPPRRKSTYPMFSDHAAPNLPSRQVVGKLVEVFFQRGKVHLRNTGSLLRARFRHALLSDVKHRLMLSRRPSTLASHP